MLAGGEEKKFPDWQSQTPLGQKGLSSIEKKWVKKAENKKPFSTKKYRRKKNDQPNRQHTGKRTVCDTPEVTSHPKKTNR